MTFLFENDVLDEDRVRIKDGVRLAQELINQRLGGVKGGSCFDVRIDANRSGSGEGAEDRIVMFTSASGWKPPSGSYPIWHPVKVAAHEYVHIWQIQVGGTGTFAGPNWLFEGAAEYIGYQAAIAGGALSSSQARMFNLSNVDFASPPPLQSSERGPRDGSDQVNYGLAALAVQHLIDNSSFESLLSYWQGLAKGTPWQTAFEAAFAMPVSDFYARFEEYRGRGFR